MSVNCRGLANREKRQDLFSKIKEDRFDIALLQDIHWDQLTLNKAKEEWGYNIISAPFNTQSRGTAILLNNTFEFTEGISYNDPFGNYSFMEIKLHTEFALVLGSIYAPNQDCPSFIKKLAETLKLFENPNILIAGDWNSTRNFKMDNKNYISQNNVKMTAELSRMISTFTLVDAWRISNPNILRYTWSQGISNKHARLDFFLCNEELLSITKNYKILPKYRSDHAPITCKLSISDEDRGPGVWRMNNSLLTDKNFEILIKKEINNFKQIYAATPYNPDYIDSITHGFEIMIPPTLFWETLLVTLRGSIIYYSKKLQAGKKRRLRELETRIGNLDQKNSTGTASTEEQTRLAELNTELVDMRKEELKGAYVRSRADWLEMGEKPSRFFLNLENRNRVNKSISEIKVDESTTITNQKEILKSVKEFYEELYKRKQTEPAVEDRDLIPTQLTPSEKQYLDSELTKSEIDLALTQQKNNKSPGIDGYSAEFFKKFWAQLGHFFTNCVNECYREGKLTTSQSTGLITCLPKTGKARNLLKNWRPISLLNTTYKIISLCITNRLRPVLNRIISQEQKGFLKGRSIADCTRVMYDIIWNCEHKLNDGLILLIDFEKAFDSLSWEYIHETLTKFNFGENFKKWIEMFQQNSNSRIILNGHLSEPFNLHRGCRQGDPISPYLFILCTEFLTLAFKTNNQIEGLKINNKTHKTSQYADDTSVFIKASERNLQESLNTLNWFYLRSGLKINFSKTKVIKIGPIRETDRRFCRENDLDWVSNFTALGIDYDVMNIKNITINNIENKIKSMEKLIQLWMFRNITPIGRICVAKSLILSKIIHVLQSLPSPPPEYLKKIEKILINFIWKGKRHEIKKETLYLEYGSGGLNMVDISKFDQSLKLTWVRKIVTGEYEWSDFAREYKIDWLVKTDENYHLTIYNATTNPFWKSVAFAYSQWFKTLKVHNNIEIENEFLWGNPNIKIPFNNTLFKNNIIYLKDMFDFQGNPLTQLELEQQIGCRIMFTSYFSIWKAVPRHWKNTILNIPKSYNVFRPLAVEWLTKDKRGTRNIRKIWNQIEQPPLICTIKWQQELGLPEYENWNHLFILPTQCKLNARCIYFQLQVLHRTLITNRKLKQFNIREDENCDKCDAIETIAHLLYECQSTRVLWGAVEQWLSGLSRNTIYFDKKSILLGNNQNEIIVNNIILMIKHEIYKSKWTKANLSIYKIKFVIKQQMELEIYLATVKNCLPKILGKWATVLNDLRTL